MMSEQSQTPEQIAFDIVIDSWRRRVEELEAKLENYKAIEEYLMIGKRQIESDNAKLEAENERLKTSNTMLEEEIESLREFMVAEDIEQAKFYNHQVNKVVMLEAELSTLKLACGMKDAALKIARRHIDLNHNNYRDNDEGDHAFTRAERSDRAVEEALAFKPQELYQAVELLEDAIMSMRGYVANGTSAAEDADEALTAYRKAKGQS